MNIKYKGKIKQNKRIFIRVREVEHKNGKTKYGKGRSITVYNEKFDKVFNVIIKALEEE